MEGRKLDKYGVKPMIISSIRKIEALFGTIVCFYGLEFMINLGRSIKNKMRRIFYYIIKISYLYEKT